MKIILKKSNTAQTISDISTGEPVFYKDDLYIGGYKDENGIVNPLMIGGNKNNSRIDKLESDFDNLNVRFKRLITDTELKLYCIEPITIYINKETDLEDVREFESNTLVDIFFNSEDTFEIVTTSDKSILGLYAWPGALSEYYSWLEGVSIFDGILFDMNNEGLYTKWSQGNQGLYHVQYAQYKNCIFWSDLPYISDVSKRTNYTMYYSSELPLCYSTIPDNTFKSFYLAYNVTCDPNWSNPVYKESFSKATWATQVFSYYGLHSIGLFDMDSTNFNITLPKDCRGLMFYAPNVLNAGVFDAINCTNFGAKSGSWRDAFAYCYQLTNLYIKNLKVNLNISWSPVNQQSMAFILENAANTNTITIWLSPHTYYGLTDANKALAKEKNIILSLVDTNTTEDNRLSMLKTDGDGISFLSNDGTYKTIEVSGAKEYVIRGGSNYDYNGLVNAINNGSQLIYQETETSTSYSVSVLQNTDLYILLGAVIPNDAGLCMRLFQATSSLVGEVMDQQFFILNGNGNKVLTDNGKYRVLSEYVTTSELETKVNEAVAGIIDNAPETLDTLGELAAAFNENSDVVEVLNQAIGNKSNVDHLHDDRYYTKTEIDALLANYVSRDIVAQMIQEALDNYTNNTPEEPSEPSEPSDIIGTIEDDNSIVIDETQLENGVYTLKYIDSNDKVIDNFNEIVSFEINN